ncbi:unnamed protein product, partial [Mesocestoides corti]
CHPLPSKRPKFTGNDEFIQNVEQLTAVVASSNRCQRGHNVPAWCVRVAPLTKMSACIAILTHHKPLPSTLAHVKRAFVKPQGKDQVGRVLLGLAGTSFTERDAIDCITKLCEVTSISRPHLETCWVPLSPPHSRQQQELLSSLIKSSSNFRSWPTNFHPNATLESLLAHGCLNSSTNDAKSYFSPKDVEWHNHWIRRAVELTKTGSQNLRNASCDPDNPHLICACIIVRPQNVTNRSPAEFQPLAEAVSTTGSSCIDHAVMLASSQVGRLNLDQRKQAFSDPKNGTDNGSNYLCTGCDAYVSTEPCLMCAMALLHARIARVFIARRLPSAGGLCSRWKLSLVNALNHHFLVFAPPEV